MRSFGTVLGALLAIGVLGCTPFARRHTKVIPPPPKPAQTAKAPAQTAQSVPVALSIPQTNVRLPAPQPVNPQAVTAPPPAEEPAESSSPEPPAPRRTPPQTAAPAPGPTTGPKPEPPAQTPPVEERPRLQPILPADERRKIYEAIETRTREINDRVAQVQKRKPSSEEEAIIGRIRSFMTLSGEAAARGDMVQADALSSRALVLARELPVGR